MEFLDQILSKHDFFRLVILVGQFEDLFYDGYFSGSCVQTYILSRTREYRKTQTNHSQLTQLLWDHYLDWLFLRTMVFAASLPVHRVLRLWWEGEPTHLDYWGNSKYPLAPRMILFTIRCLLLWFWILLLRGCRLWSPQSPYPNPSESVPHNHCRRYNYRELIIFLPLSSPWHYLVESFGWSSIPSQSRNLEPTIHFCYLCFLLIWCTLSESTDYSGSSDGAMYDWNECSKLRFEDTVEILASSNAHQTVAIRQLGKYTNIVRIFKLTTIGHDV